ncbi:MAG: hypothetical protein R2757_02605 [Draconibacterium sp.]
MAVNAQNHNRSIQAKLPEQEHNKLKYSQPVIGAWFWDEEEFKPEGYKQFIDDVSIHSCFDLLSTAIRVPGRDITDIDVHNQVKKAVEYANEKGIQIALELDPRVARRKFEEMYPTELQESLWLQEIEVSAQKPVETTIRSVDLTDHMIGKKTPYVSLYGSLSRVYSYQKTSEGILASSIKEVTKECSVIISTKDSIVVSIPPCQENNNLYACVLVSFTHLTPDVFSPHLIEFTRELIYSYSDVPLAGGMRDEWGFPPSVPAKRMAAGNHFWYSKYYEEEYRKRTKGRELLYDFLLMYIGIKGEENSRINAINHYMEMNWQRNAILENDFYQTIKDVFGPEAAVVTHATWYPFPNKLEIKKNALCWWSAKRDWAQTDETTPFAVRTALAKKWNSSVWYNQYYSSESKSYQTELWSSALGGGRLNYHPIYPVKNKNLNAKRELFRGEIMRGESRVRLLNYISETPLNCPVAVIFGHSSVMNWVGPYYEDVGMKLVDKLWGIGIPTDLIPTSEITNKSLKVDDEGWIYYGKQRYSAIVLYNPEFETAATAEFFKKASNGQTSLFQIGNWTRDFDGNPMNGNRTLPNNMLIINNIDSVVNNISGVLAARNIEFQTPASRLVEGFGHTSLAPPTSGQCQLIDGTVIQVAGTENAAGDNIISEIKIGKHDVIFDAIGLAAVRLDQNGNVQALAAGGLKYFKTGKMIIQLDERIDLAFWKNNEGKYEGVIQGTENTIPSQLKSISKKWDFLQLPAPLKE